MTLSITDQYSKIIRDAECDWDDDENCFTSAEGNGIPQYELKLDDTEIREQVKIIVMSEGIVATEFLKETFTANWKNCGKILKVVEHHHSDELEFCGLPHAAKPVSASDLFSLGDDILVCCCCSPLTPEEFSTYSTLVISDFCNVQNVVVLTVLPMASYKSGFYQDQSDIITRMLTTLKETKQSNVMPLEQPNILTGVSASVLTLCEIKRIPARVFVLYSSYPDLDSGITQAFKNCLETIPEVKAKILEHSLVEKKYISNFNRGNLYM